MSADQNKDKKSVPMPVVEQAGASDSDISSVHTVLMREKPEPIEGYSPIPLVLLFLFSGLIFWAGIYLERYRGNWDPLVYKHDFRGSSGAAEVVVALTPESPEWIKRGQKLYTQNCANCHGPQGAGVPGAFPPLAESEWVIGPNSERFLPKILIYGLVGPVTVKGNEYNGNMPAQSSYTDAQIAQVLSYIRTQWGNQAGVISDTAVAEIRKQYGKRDPWSAKELLDSVK